MERHTYIQNFFSAVVMETLPANHQQRPTQSFLIFWGIRQNIIMKICHCSCFRLDIYFCSLLLFILNIFWELYSVIKMKPVSISFCPSLVSWPACLYLYLYHLSYFVCSEERERNQWRSFVLCTLSPGTSLNNHSSH